MAEDSQTEETEKFDNAVLKVEESTSRPQSRSESSGGFFSFFRRRSSAAVSELTVSETEGSSDDENEENKDTLIEELIKEEPSDNEGNDTKLSTAHALI